jgi:hypothetical protein
MDEMYNMKIIDALTTNIEYHNGHKNTIYRVCTHQIATLDQLACVL